MNKQAYEQYVINRVRNILTKHAFSKISFSELYTGQFGVNPFTKMVKRQWLPCGLHCDQDDEEMLINVPNPDYERFEYQKVVQKEFLSLINKNRHLFEKELTTLPKVKRSLWQLLQKLFDVADLSSLLSRKKEK